MSTALIVIDVQNYFIKDKTRDVPQKIADFIKQGNFDDLAFTQFINLKDSNFTRILEWKRCFESPEIDLAEELRGFSSDQNTFQKVTFSALKSDRLLQYLHHNGVTKLLLAGLDIDACVLATAYDAFDLGYDFEVLKGLSGSSVEDEIRQAGEKIIDRNLSRKKSF